MTEKKAISAEEFEQKFEAGEDITAHLDLSKAVKKVNVDIPLWAIKALDAEADRIGVARQALIKMWLVEKLDAIHNLKEPLAPAREAAVRRSSKGGVKFHGTTSSRSHSRTRRPSPRD